MNRIATIKGNTLLINGIAVLIAVGLYVLVFRGVWDVQIPAERPGIVTLIILLAGVIVLHEGIHGAAALMFVDRGKISFSAKWLVVICRVDGMMTRGQYVFYALAPAALLGLIGIALYYVVGSVEQRFLAALLFLGGVSSGGGDFWFVSQVLRHPRESLVVDLGIEIEVYMNNPTENSGVVK
ncbi:MAG TPA: hypothetical protein DGH68_12785 [Bacteroidetes bacterium]|jgi:hypothetical protein|nr:hypothetical protein [Bacteroidota bacterium]